MDARQEIMSILSEVALDGGKQLAEDFVDDSLLFDSGLDSLDFAIVVARLEEELEVDPFAEMSTPVYPKTLAQFIQIYEERLSTP